MNAMTREFDAAFSAPRGAERKPSAPEICTHALFAQGQRDLLIHHAGSVYRLTITRQNKLILTK